MNSIFRNITITELLQNTFSVLGDLLAFFLPLFLVVLIIREIIRKIFQR